AACSASPSPSAALHSSPTRRSSDLLLHAFTADTAIKAKYHLPEKATVLVMIDDPDHLLKADQMTNLATSEADHLLITNEAVGKRSEEHTSELQSRFDLVCRPLLEKK